MKEPFWLSDSFLHGANAALVERFGGLLGPCKENLLHSALNRPQHLFAYGDDVTLFDLAAAYGFGLAKNHPFTDGNKRVAFVAMATFLERNGWKLVVEETEAVVVMVELAASIMTEPELAKWLKKYSVKM